MTASQFPNQVNISDSDLSDLDLDLERPLSWQRRLFSHAMTAIAFVFSILAVIPLASLLIEIIRKGAAGLSWDIFVHTPAPVGTGDPSGFINAIVGTLIMVAIAAIISVPIGVLTGVFLSEFASNSKAAEFVRFTTVVLSSTPSIIAGVFAYRIIVRGSIDIFGFVITGFSAMAGGVALGVIMLPIVALTTTEALKLVPNSYRLASASLGSGRFQTIFRIVIPNALPAITTGVLLAVARAAGETAPLIFTALSSQFWPDWSTPSKLV
jgi:phosphate transport system permease protein